MLCRRGESLNRVRTARPDMGKVMGVPDAKVGGPPPTGKRVSGEVKEALLGCGPSFDLTNARGRAKLAGSTTPCCAPSRPISTRALPARPTFTLRWPTGPERVEAAKEPSFPAELSVSSPRSRQSRPGPRFEAVTNALDQHESAAQILEDCGSGGGPPQHKMYAPKKRSP